jgi:hypothetical protein
MRSHWGTEEFKLMAKATLTFTSEHARLIRREALWLSHDPRYAASLQ